MLLMKLNSAVIVVWALSFIISGCSMGLNTKTKEMEISTGIFGGDIQKMRQSVVNLQSGRGIMTKEDVRKAGWNFNAKNVKCFRGPSAMPLIVGDVKNNADLSTVEKIEANAKAADAFEACGFPEFKVKSKKDRWFFSKNKGKTKGPEITFVISFKNGVLLSAREDTARYRDEPEIEKSFGGNVLETLMGIGMSAGKRF